MRHYLSLTIIDSQLSFRWILSPPNPIIITTWAEGPCGAHHLPAPHKA